MLDKEFPIPLDNDMTCLATTLITAGAVLIGLADWKTVGWVLVVFGIETLWLAYHFAIAPYKDEPQTIPEN